MIKAERKSKYWILVSLLILTLVGSTVPFLDTKNESPLPGLEQGNVLVGSDYTSVSSIDGLQDVAVLGDYAYVVNNSGMTIFDISNPGNPIRRGIRTTTASAMGIDVSGNVAYVACNSASAGLATINVMNPRNPRTPVYANIGSAAEDVVVENGIVAYVAGGAGGLITVNVSNPSNPNVYHQEDTTGFSRAVFIAGKTTYIADSLSGLAVINTTLVMNPGTPVYEDTTGCALDVFVSGDYAYVADNDSGLAIIDVSNPNNPGTPNYLVISGDRVESVYVSGNYAYLGVKSYFGFSTRLVIVDVSDPLHPVQEGQCNLPGLMASGICVDGIRAFIANGYFTTVKIAEYLSSPGALTIKDMFDTVQVFVDGDFAYVTDYYSIAIINISDPLNPGTPVYCNLTGIVEDVFVSGDFAYVADGASGLAIIDVTDPTNPGTPVYEDTSGNANGVFVTGHYAYVADGSSGLAIINVINHKNPGTPVYLPLGSPTGKVFVSGNCAFVTLSGAISIVNVTRPSNPSNILQPSIGDSTWDVKVVGGFAYVADGNLGLAIMNVTDPNNPGTPVHRSLTTTARGVYVSGDRAYVTTIDGLAAIDIINPLSPGTPVYRNITSASRGVFVSGDYVYMGLYSAGMGVSKIKDLWYVLPETSLNSISPNPHYDDNITVSWGSVPGATGYDIFRTTSPISTLTGNTPTFTNPTSTVIDTVPGNGTYYYFVAARNARGTAWISMYVSVTVSIDAFEPGYFSLYNSGSWTTDQTPDIVIMFIDTVSGVNATSVQFAYSTTGETAPTNWANVTGVYTDITFMNPVANGYKNWAYALVTGVPFNQDSNVSNTIRLRARDMAGHLGIQSPAAVVLIDSSPPSFAVLTAPGAHYIVPPSIHVQFNDTLTLNNAFYKVDSYSPGGTDTNGWRDIFGGCGSNSYDGQFVILDSVWDLLSVGSHVVYFKAWDDVTNVNDSTSVSWQFYKEATLTAPTLNDITPNPDYDGNITLSWSSVLYAVNYSVYRSTASFIEVDEPSVILVTVTTGISFEDTNLSVGSYYYMVVARSNYSYSFSSLQNVNVSSGSGPSGGPLDPLTIALIVVIGAVAGIVISTYYYKKNRSPPKVKEQESR
nr:hypothetical protein [Candidatus Sigynarchaeota archaeon]